MDLREFQRTIADTYGAADKARGVEDTFMWFAEEVGELSRAIRREDRDNQVEEFSDVLAWLVSLADLMGIDIADAAGRYRDGCPKCHASPCACGN